MTSKIKKTYKIIINLIFFISNFIIIAANTISKQVNNLDEIWNYNTARQIMNGLIPYKEISMITTPLFPTINAMFLRIFGDELYVFRIIFAFMLAVILFLVYKFLEKLLDNKLISIISVEAILILYFEYLYYDYNLAMILILLCLELLELKLYKNRNKNNKFLNILIGILAGLSICTKQTIGITIAAIICILPLINNKKNSVKQRIKTATIRIIGIVIPVLIFIIFLIITNSLNDFVDYAILGIKTFSNSIPYTRLLNNDKIYIRLLAITMPIIALLMGIFEIIYIISKKLYKNDEISKINILILYSFPLLIVVYPIADEVHFVIAIFQIIILMLYLFFKALQEIYFKIKFKEKIYIAIIIQVVIIIFLGCIIARPVINNYDIYKQKNRASILHYNNLIVADSTVKIIESLNQIYLENKETKKVLLVDASAAIYNVPLDIYNKNYDMFLKGNIGKNGEEGIIEEIQNNTDCIYLVRKENMKSNWQTPTKVIKYIRENLEKKGEIAIFDIYYKN